MTRVSRLVGLVQCGGPAPGVACGDSAWVAAGRESRCDACVERRAPIENDQEINDGCR